MHTTDYIIKGLRARRVYIAFWLTFIFCRIKLIFGRLTCFDMKSNVLELSWSICASFSRNNVCKKTQLSPGDLLLNEKQIKETFYFAKFNLQLYNYANQLLQLR